MKAKKLDCLHIAPEGYRYKLCPKCIEKKRIKKLESFAPNPFQDVS